MESEEKKDTESKKWAQNEKNVGKPDVSTISLKMNEFSTLQSQVILKGKIATGGSCYMPPAKQEIMDNQQLALYGWIDRYSCSKAAGRKLKKQSISRAIREN